MESGSGYTSVERDFMPHVRYWNGKIYSLETSVVRKIERESKLRHIAVRKVSIHSVNCSWEKICMLWIFADICTMYIDVYSCTNRVQNESDFLDILNPALKHISNFVLYFTATRNNCHTFNNCMFEDQSNSDLYDIWINGVKKFLFKRIYRKEHNHITWCEESKDHGKR